MEQKQHIVDGLGVKSNGRTIAFIRAYVSNKDNSSIKVIHSGIKEAIKHFIDEGFDVIRGTSDGFEDKSPNLQLIVETLTSPAKETIVSIQSGYTNKVPNFDRIYDALIQHMVLKGFKRL